MNVIPLFPFIFKCFLSIFAFSSLTKLRTVVAVSSLTLHSTFSLPLVKLDLASSFGNIPPTAALYSFIYFYDNSI